MKASASDVGGNTQHRLDLHRQLTAPDNPPFTHSLTHKFTHFPFTPPYSLLNDFTGLVKAAFTDWKLTVKKAISITAIPEMANIHHCISTL